MKQFVQMKIRKNNLPFRAALFLLFSLSFSAGFSQNGVRIATSSGTADGSAMLDVVATNKGMLVPRMTAANRIAISSPANGLLVYQTDGTAGFWYFNGSIWVQAVGPQGPAGATGATGATGPIGATGPAGSANISGTTNYHIKFTGSTTGGNSLVYDNGTNVGIGTAGPTQKLDIQGGNARINNTFIGDVGHGATWAGFSHSSQNSPSGYGLLQSNDGAYTFINKQNTNSGYIGFRVANADVAVINNSGFMGIGTTVPEQRLHVNGGFIMVVNNSSDAGLLARGGSNFRHHLIGLYPGWSTYDVNLAGYNYWNSGPDFTQRIVCGGSGSYLPIYASAHNFISSARYKENIQDLDYSNAIGAIMHLRPRSYNMASSGEKALGLIAEEVLPHIPDAIKLDQNGKAEALDLYAVVSVLIKAVQEQELKIENLEALLEKQGKANATEKSYEPKMNSSEIAAHSLSTGEIEAVRSQIKQESQKALREKATAKPIKSSEITPEMGMPVIMENVTPSKPGNLQGKIEAQPARDMKIKMETVPQNNR